MLTITKEQIISWNPCRYKSNEEMDQLFINTNGNATYQDVLSVNSISDFDKIWTIFRPELLTETQILNTITEIFETFIKPAALTLGLNNVYLDMFEGVKQFLRHEITSEEYTQKRMYVLSFVPQFPPIEELIKYKILSFVSMDYSNSKNFLEAATLASGVYADTFYSLIENELSWYEKYNEGLNIIVKDIIEKL